jgi:hypothetical protein
MNPAITAVLIGIISAFSFGGGFALSEARMSREQIARFNDSRNWECKTTLIYNPNKMEQTDKTK